MWEYFRTHYILSLWKHTVLEFINKFFNKVHINNSLCKWMKLKKILNNFNRQKQYLLGLTSFDTMFTEHTEKWMHSCFAGYLIKKSIQTLTCWLETANNRNYNTHFTVCIYCSEVYLYSICCDTKWDSYNIIRPIVLETICILYYQYRQRNVCIKFIYIEYLSKFLHTLLIAIMINKSKFHHFSDKKLMNITKLL